MVMDREIQKANKKTLMAILDADNVAELFNGEDGGLGDDTKLGNIGADAVAMYDLDKSDPCRQEKADKWEKGQDIVKQVIEQKDTPIMNASNVKYPMLTNACIQFNARAYPAIISGNSVLKPQLIGNLQAPTDQDVQQMQQHMPPEQFQQVMEELKPLMEKQERADRATEFMNWQLFNELEEWEEDSDRLLLMLALYGSMFRKIWNSPTGLVSKIATPEKLVMPSNAPTMDASPRITEEFTLYPNEVEQKIRSGVYVPFVYEKTGEDKDAEIEFIEQHCWLDLDEDEFKEPYILIVEKKTNQVVRIQPNFQMKDVQVNEDGEVERIDKILYYTKYTFIPSSDGSIYDLGFFDILYPLNEVVDTTINQLLDAGRLANSNSGFMAQEARLRKGSMNFATGEWKSVNVKGDDLRKGIFPLNFPGPSTVLFQLLGFIVESGKEVANLKDVLMGEHASSAPATTTLALIEQGSKVYSAIHKRIYRALKQEFAILRMWNERVINEDRYKAVVDREISADDFNAESFDFIPVADPEVATDMQRMGRAEFLLGFKDDPYVNQMEIRRRAFEAANIDGIDDLLSQPPNQQEQIKQQEQALQAKAQELQERDLQLREREMARKELETEIKSLDSEVKRLLDETKAIDNLASAEAREAGQQLDEYRDNVRAIDDYRRRILELEKLKRDAASAANAQAVPRVSQGAMG